MYIKIKRTGRGGRGEGNGEERGGKDGEEGCSILATPNKD